jgi:phosphonate transport system ATP-binding protein
MPATTSPPTAPELETATLSVRGLTKRYGERTVLEGVDLDVAAGEVVSVLGANGSGKSTALRCVVGLVRPEAGSVTVSGRTVTPGLPQGEVAIVFQRTHLVRRRSVLDNVCAGALGRLSLSQSWAAWAVPRDVRGEAMACLDRVGLADRAHDRAGRLSGGQQQRVAVARALCQRARVLLADEPVSALDPAAAESVMRLLRSLAIEDGIAVAAVLHHPDLARRHCDRVVGLVDGRVAFVLCAAEFGDHQADVLYAADRAERAQP